MRHSVLMPRAITPTWVALLAILGWIITGGASAWAQGVETSDIPSIEPPSEVGDGHGSGRLRGHAAGGPAPVSELADRLGRGDGAGPDSPVRCRYDRQAFHRRDRRSRERERKLGRHGTGDGAVRPGHLARSRRGRLHGPAVRLLRHRHRCRRIRPIGSAGADVFPDLGCLAPPCRGRALRRGPDTLADEHRHPARIGGTESTRDPRSGTH